MKRLREARDVHCPQCYSNANSPCVKRNGKKCNGYHLTRWHELTRQQHEARKAA